MTNTNIFRFVSKKTHIIVLLLLAVALSTAFMAKTSAAGVGTGRIKVITYLNFADGGKKTDSRLPYVNVIYRCKASTGAYANNWTATNANGVGITSKLPANYKCQLIIRPPKGYK